MKSTSVGQAAVSRAPKGRAPNLLHGLGGHLRAVIAVVASFLLVAAGLALVAPPASAAGTTFSSTWDTTKTSTGSSGASQITLPLTAAGDYNFVVNWGDSTTNTITSYNQAEVTHTYGSAGVKTITIAGTIKGWRFGNGGDKLKLKDITAWGPLQLGNEGGYFWGVSNLALSATDGPDLSATNNLSNAFYNATSMNGDLSAWDVSGVTNLNSTFRGATAFNGNVSNWNVSSVTTMNGTFRGATAFNSNIAAWNVSSVTNMASMFNGAPAFDRNLSTWNVANVTDMASMFASAGVSRTNYDALLVGWAALSVKRNVEFDAGSAKYTLGPASVAHTSLTTDDAWTITDGGITSAPDAPTGLSTTRADTGATVTWNASAPNNSPVLEYVATISPAPNSGSATCSVVPPASRSCTWANLNNGQTYGISVTARNVIGTSPASATATVVPEVDTPNAPVVTPTGSTASALALDQKARVTWQAPTGGGTPITYTVTATPGGQTCVATAPTLTCDVTGLTNSTSYTFQVTATNPGGTSAPSVASNAVTPGPVFATTWNTSNTVTDGSGAKQIRLPLVADGTYNFVVAWGDGSFSNIITSDVDPGNLSGITHSYSSGGVKNLTITGTLNGWNMQTGVAGDKERLKLTGISSWGSVRLGTPTKQGQYFKNATNLAVTATDALNLTGTTSLASAFEGASSFNGAIGNWNVGNVTDMSSMFAGATSFNQDLDAWQPANVTTMANMFKGATAFNKPLSNWGDVGKVTTMASMFDNADAFNSAVAWTNLGELTTTAGMFANADNFNQALGWTGSEAKLANTSSMFSSTTHFNGDVSTLDMAHVTNASAMFSAAAAFNQPLSTWNVGAVTDFTNMFKNTSAFNQPLGSWSLGSGINLSDMFSGAAAFNQDLSGWTFEGVTRFGLFLKNSALANQNAGSGIYNYNKLLQRLASQNVEPNTSPGSTVADRTIDSSPAKYSAGPPTVARAALTARGFTITDGGQTNKNVPNAPEGVFGVKDGNSATITWTAPNDNNSPITGYTVTAIHKTDPNGNPNVVCTNSDTTCVFDSNLPAGADNYNFVVTATNAVGTSAPSATDAPATPAKPLAVAGDGKVTVTIAEPTSGALPTTYTVTSTPESKTCTITVPATSCDVTGLTNGTSYTFTATAENWVGSSAPSPVSDAAIPGKVFASTWRTNNTSAGSSGASQIKLPLTSTGTYDFYVAWGDGTTDHITSWNQAEATHSYGTSGTKNITITGTITGWRFNATGDRLKILTIDTWGPLNWGNAGGYFYGAANLAVPATDTPDLSGTTSFFNAFYDATSFDGVVTSWNVSNVTDMTNAFKGTPAFEGLGLGSWNVGNVQQFDSMFESSAMSANISAWQPSAALDMNRMFANATNFNQSIDNWETPLVADMASMFSGAESFNQDMGAWNTGEVTDMSGMFQGSAIDTGRDYSGWDIAKVANFTNMFRNNPALTMPDSVQWYNKLLTGWATKIHTDRAVTLTVCGSADTSGDGCAEGAPQYSAGAPQNARLDLIDHGWTIIDGGLSGMNVPDQIVNVSTQEDGPDTLVAWDTPANNGSPIQYFTITAVNKSDHNDATECSTVPWGGFPEAGFSGVCGYSSADYLFSVTATNGIGTSIPSSIDVPAVNAPIVTPAGSGTLRVTIDPAATGGTPQNYLIVDKDGGPWLCQFDAPQTSCLVTGLQNGTDYQFRALAVNWVGESAMSAPSAPVAPTADVFTSSWDTTETSAGSSNSTSVHLPLLVGGDYDFYVTWGDGHTDHVTSATDPGATHVYGARGTYDVAITGTIEGWRFNGDGDRLKLLDVSNWGPLRLGNAGGYFRGAANLTLSTTDPINLTGTTDLSRIFNGATLFDGDVSGWDVHNVTDMSEAFADSGFTGDLSTWNTGSVTNMAGMFANTAFNGDISGWNTGSVTDMSSMFSSASSFNQDLSGWDTSQVTGMTDLFKGSAFTGDVSGWDITKATNLSGMFQNIAPLTGNSTISWYNRLLIGWASEDVPTRAADSVPFTACGSVDSSSSCPDGLKYYGTAATAARASLVEKGWAIVDGGAADANVPDSPSGISIVRNGSEATVSWTAPDANGSPITGYQVTTDPSAITCESATTECVLTGLNENESFKYSVTVTATNGIGTSVPSAPYPVLRPGKPGTPSVVVGDAAATVTVTAPTTGGPVDSYTVTSSPDGLSCTITLPADPLSCEVTGLSNGTAYTFTAVAQNDGGTSDASNASGSVTPLAPARNPEFGTPTPTADGFTAQITNFDPAFAWEGTATNSGVVDIDGSGLVTVTGVAADTLSTATITTTQFGFAGGSGDAEATSLKAGLEPAFGTVTPTADGFTVQISNYSALYGWESSSTESGQVAISNTGLVTVTNVAPDTLAEVTVTTTRTGYAAVSNMVPGTSLKAAKTPDLGTAEPTAGGFTVPITNYSAEDGFAWEAASSTPDGSSAAINPTTGLVTVTGVDPNTATSVTVTTTQAGYVDGTNTRESKSLHAARTPAFGAATSTDDGFTFPITNYGTAGDGFTWTVDSVDPNTAAATIDPDSGLVTVTGLDPLGAATVTIKTVQADYVDGSAEKSGTALDVPGNPVLGDVTQTADGFTVPITNYYTGGNNTNYSWSVDALTEPASAVIVEDNPAIVLVTGLTPGQSQEITVRTTRVGYADGAASKTGAALESARNPQFDEPVRNWNGYTAQISNYGDAGDGFAWTVGNIVPDSANAYIDADTGLLRVEDVEPGAQVTVTVRTTRDGYVSGTGDAVSSALNAPRNPVFGTTVPTTDGFTVPITNFGGAGSDYVWTVEATTPEGAQASINPTTGVVTVTDVAPGTEASVTVKTTRDGYVDGTETATATSITGTAWTPAFGDVTRTSTGFTVPITNYGGPGADFNWSVTSVSPAGQANIDPETGVVTVTDLELGQTATVTIGTTRAGYADGTNSQEGAALDPQFNPILGTATPTADGFTAQITNYNDAGVGFTWGTQSPAPSGAQAAISETGLVTVTDVAPGTDASVTVTVNKPGFAEGTALASGKSTNGVAYNPTFGEVTRTADGFTVPITNYTGEGSNYDWSVTSVTPAGSADINSETGVVTVTGVDAGAEATVTVGTTRTGYDPGSNSQAGTALQAARNPEFNAATPTADGFTVQISNFGDAGDGFDWAVGATTPEGAQASIDDNGLVTVTDVAPGTDASVTVTTTRTGYVGGTATQPGKSTNGGAFSPAFGAVTRTADGFTVPITDYTGEGANYAWSVTSVTPTGSAEIDSQTGGVTVTGLSAGTEATVTIATTRTGYDPGSNSQAGTALEAARTPEFGTATPTADGFTVEITNFGAGFDWAVGTVTPEGAQASIDDNGLVTVTDVAPGTDASVTVTTAKTGYVGGTATKPGKSINGAARNPVFGSVTRTADGFTVPITNYAGDGAAFDWSVNTVSPEGVGDIDSETGVVTVTGLSPNTEATVTVGTTRTGYDPGTASQAGTSLEVARNPEFGTPAPTADGFTVQITNYGDAGDGYDWAVGAVTPEGAQAEIDAGGLVTVTGVAPGTNSTVTVNTTKAGHVDGTADQPAKSLEAAHVPEFGAVTRTPVGYTVQITNYGGDGANFNWDVHAVTDGFADLNAETGLITVTELAPGDPATVTVDATRDDYALGRSDVEGSALNAARTPQFGATTPTADGFTVQITNFNDTFQWTGTATATSDDVTITGSGRVTVSGVAADTLSELTVTSKKDGYVDGTDSVTESSLKSAHNPTFSGTVRTVDGFTATIDNYDPAYHWHASATNTNDDVEIGNDGSIVVTGVSPGITAVVTVATTRTGYADGSADVSGTALTGAALTPRFAQPVSTAVGFNVQIDNYRGGFDWQTSASPQATVSINSSGYMRVSGLAPGARSTVTVTTSRTGYAQGSADVTGTADPSAPPAPKLKAPARPTITKLKLTYKKRNKSLVSVYYRTGSDGGAPILGGIATCKQQGSRYSSSSRGKHSPLKVKKLTYNKTYKCSVVAYNALGASSPSATKKIKIKVKGRKS